MTRAVVMHADLSESREYDPICFGLGEVSVIEWTDPHPRPPWRPRTVWTWRCNCLTVSARPTDTLPNAVRNAAIHLANRHTREIS